MRHRVRHPGQLATGRHRSERVAEFTRKGIGTALYAASEARCREDGRTSLVGGGYENDFGRSGVDFAHALGFETANQEDHFRCPLPMPDHQRTPPGA